MCGILAVAGTRTPRKEDITAALGTLCHRGPDGSHTLSLLSCTLAQARLAIIDLSTGDQPMVDAENGNAITFNGEIYNYKELRAELETLGHAFVTQSDTEVILKAYAQYGENCPKHLDGMFAIVLWDKAKDTVFVARDRFGKKPLYYAQTPEGAIAFASEIKALFPLGIKGEVDPAALDNYLQLMYVPPWKSIYKNIHVVAPAQCGFLAGGELSLHTYWKMPDAPSSDTYEKARARITELFDEACRKRMIADVEVGALLSGGVDSTLVCAYASKYASHPLKTFSVGYEGATNELPYAEQASKAIGTEHYTLNATGDLFDELKAVIAYMDEPHADSSNFPQHLVSELAGSKVKVALSGDGADEIFLGYGWYWRYWNTRKIVRLRNALFSSPFKEYLKSLSIFKGAERAQLWKDASSCNEDIIAPQVLTAPGNGIKKINRFDLTTYLPGQLLSKVDQTGMMHSLEVRSPFLDHHLAEYVYNLPETYKTDKHQGKIILKDILTDLMPKEFVYRRKQGFGAPVRDWLKSEKLHAQVKAYLGANARIYQYLRKEYVDDLLAEFYERKDEGRFYQIWSLLCLELWFQAHHQNHA